MAQDKGSFIFYTSWKVWLKELNDAQKVNWLNWILDYTTDLNPPLPEDPLTRLACVMAQETLKRDLKKWEHTREKRVEAGRKGGQAKSNNSKQKVANASKCKQDLANLPVNVNGNVNVNVNVNDNVEDKSSYNIENTINDIFLCWNSQEIIKHSKLTKAIKSAITGALKVYSCEIIKTCIVRYKEMLDSNYKYCEYKWTLENFLKQKNAISDFTDEGSKWNSYLSWKETKDNKNPRIEGYNFEEGMI